MSKRRMVVEASGARFLAPKAVGSSIRWNVTVDKTDSGYPSYNAEVSLSDCNRFINWSDNGYGHCEPDNATGHMLEKVNAALEELQNLKKALEIAIPVYRSLVEDHEKKREADEAAKAKPASQGDIIP